MADAITLPIVFLDHAKDLPLPRYASTGAAGMDICAALAEPLIIEPMARHAVPTGLTMAIPEGYEIQIRPRSGLAFKQGLTVVNAPGTIDSDYRGEVKVLLINLGTDPVEITHGMRIAQMIMAPVTIASPHIAKTLDDTERGGGGFGSTGTGQPAEGSKA